MQNIDLSWLWIFWKVTSSQNTQKKRDISGLGVPKTTNSFPTNEPNKNIWSKQNARVSVSQIKRWISITWSKRYSLDLLSFCGNGYLFLWFFKVLLKYVVCPSPHPQSIERFFHAAQQTYSSLLGQSWWGSEFWLYRVNNWDLIFRTMAPYGTK